MESTAKPVVVAVDQAVDLRRCADFNVSARLSWLNKNDYFVTENVDDFIRGGRREALEQALPGLKIRTTAELLRDLTER